MFNFGSKDSSTGAGEESPTSIVSSQMFDSGFSAVTTSIKADRGKDFVSWAEVEGKTELDFIQGGKEKLPEMQEESELAFLYNVFYWSSTAIKAIWPQLVFVWINCLLANIVYKYREGFVHPTSADVQLYGSQDGWLPTDAEKTHSAIASILGFLVVFRSSQGYGSYVEGRKIFGAICNNLREMAMNTYTFNVRSGMDVDAPMVVDCRKRIRRHINLLYAVMRQQLREFHNGFQPGSDLAAKTGEPNFKNGEPTPEWNKIWQANWQLDPVKPRIAQLMTFNEYQQLNEMPSAMRIAWVEVQLCTNCQELAHYLSNPGFFLQLFMKNAEETVNMFKSAYRISETPVPMPYRHLLYVLCFVFVNITPWIYVNDGRNMIWASGWTASTMICIAYYGIMELAAGLTNPFGWDDVDLDLQMFGKRVHNETRIIAKAVQPDVDTVDYLAKLPGELPKEAGERV